MKEKEEVSPLMRSRLAGRAAKPVVKAILSWVTSIPRNLKVLFVRLVVRALQ